MKREISWGATAAVTLAAVIGISTQYLGKPSAESNESHSAASKGASIDPNTKSPFEQGPCVDIEERLRVFLLDPDSKSQAAPGSCYGRAGVPAKDRAQGEQLRQAAKELRFVIAVLPDPAYTHFPLTFDRFTEAIQQGATDSDYIYDSSWLPWQADDTNYALIKDKEKAEDKKKLREEQPGILLFRKKLERTNRDPSEPFQHGLVVFVVGEEPTQGIHRTQFENAAAWIAALDPASNQKPAQFKLPAGGILGPSFSGSLPSLAGVLADIQAKSQARTTAPDKGKPLRIYSGNLSGKNAVNWFTKVTAAQDIRFASFQQSDDVLIDNYCNYLRSSQFNLRRLAIVSEDETAYGSEAEPDDQAREPDPPYPGCYMPQEGSNSRFEASPRFFYPRDISALRSAYQKQSIFTTQSSQSPSDSGKRTLPTNIGDPEGLQHDTIRDYSGDQAAQSEEAVLQQIVSQLRAHQSQYVLLRSSNPLDQLFLAHYLRLAYPQGRIVILGADLLLRRESGAARLSGIMTLTTYPLLPWNSHWTSDHDSKNYHSHRVFSQDGTEGTYIATRYLLQDDWMPSSCSKEDAASYKCPHFLLTNQQFKIPDYNTPSWLRIGKGTDASYPPPAWLSVLGRDDFWPLAAMNDESLRDQGRKSFLTIAPEVGSSLVNVLTLGRSNPASRTTAHPSLLGAMPLSLRIVLLSLFLWSLFNFVCCCFPSITAKPSHRAYFVAFAHCYRSNRLLLVFGSLAISSTATALAWGYGAMSMGGVPLDEARLCYALLPCLWIIVGASVWVNLWKQHDLVPRLHFRRNMPRKWRLLRIRLFRSRPMLVNRWRLIWPLLAYISATLAFYYLLYFCIERVLIPANRIPNYWRDMNLTSGVSPLVPIIALTAGTYMWFWHSLQGLAFFGPDAPLLPSKKSLEFPAQDGTLLPWLGMFSKEQAGSPVVANSWPFARPVLRAAIVAFAFLVVLALLLGADHAEPIRSLGARSYAQLICVLMAVLVSLMLVSAWQLLEIWIGLRRLLVHLDRVPLRRSMAAFPGVSWGSVWKISGNVLDMRYKLLVNQLECITHLHNSLASTKREQLAFWPALASYSKVDTALSELQAARVTFSAWYTTNCGVDEVRDQDSLKALQEKLAWAAGCIFAWMLLPAWRAESDELLPVRLLAPTETDKAAGESPSSTHLAPHIRYAEQFVCYVYLGFIQNILGRMRTLVISVLWLYVSATIAMASYPFDPRPVVNGAMVVLFLVLGTIIVTVYMQMHRDPILSLVTNTKPGELDGDFWIKLVSFGAGPVLGLMATIFPELTNFLFSWVAPGISSVK